MLVANDSSNARVIASAAVRDEAYTCPECAGRMVLRQGTVKIAHFAHFRRSPDCGMWARESEEHLRLKAAIVERLQGQGLRAEPEWWVPDVRLRADVMAWAADGRLVAFEVQCSRRDPRELEEKIEAYRSLGIVFHYVLPDERLSPHGWDLNAASPRVVQMKAQEVKVSSDFARMLLQRYQTATSIAEGSDFYAVETRWELWRETVCTATRVKVVPDLMARALTGVQTAGKKLVLVDEPVRVFNAPASVEPPALALIEIRALPPIEPEVPEWVAGWGDATVRDRVAIAANAFDNERSGGCVVYPDRHLADRIAPLAPGFAWREIERVVQSHFYDWQKAERSARLRELVGAAA